MTTWALRAVFVAGTLGIFTASVPISLSLEHMAFGDPGSTLKADQIVSQGLVPTVDFAYPYGLFTLVVGRASFAALGRTPAALAVLTLLCLLAIGAGFASIAASLNFSRWQIALLAAALPIAVMPQYPNLAHTCEAALLVAGVALLARGQQSAALLAGTASSFFKPSMGFISCLAVVLSILWEGRRRRLNARWHFLQILPATLLVFGVVPLLAGLWGWNVALHSLVPVAAKKIYQGYSYGFFNGLGRDFWRPPGARWTYYLGTPVGFWLCSTLVLVAAAGVILFKRLPSLMREGAASRSQEVILACAAAHLAFIGLFFGHSSTWVYYSFLLVIGVAAASAEFPRGRWVAGALIALALSAHFTPFRAIARKLSELSRDPSDGLWSSLPLHREWSALRHRCAGGGCYVLSHAGFVDGLFPEMKSPQSWFVLRPVATGPELNRIRLGLASANLVIVPLFNDWSETVLRFPEFAEELADFSPLRRGTFFQLYQRRPGLRGRAAPAPVSTTTGGRPD